MTEGPKRRYDPADKPDYRLLSAGGDPYLYLDTKEPVLRNRFGIKDAEQLATVERIRTGARLEELTNRDVKVPTSLQGLQAVHKHIFQDVYHWAGHVRRVDMHKPEPVLSGASVAYSETSKIRQEANVAFKALNARNWQTMDLDEKAKTFSKDLTEVWRVHPFREGNTRTVVTFVDLYAKKKEMPLDVELLGQNAEYVRSSLVVATYGRTDDLERIVKDALERGQSLERDRGPVLDLGREREQER